jgi:hypothetical protein
VAAQQRDPLAVRQVELDALVIRPREGVQSALGPHQPVVAGAAGGAVSATSNEFVRNTRWPVGRSSLAASAIQAAGSHHRDAPYSLITPTTSPRCSDASTTS